jgi:hypothetical protein
VNDLYVFENFIGRSPFYGDVVRFGGICAFGQYVKLSADIINSFNPNLFLGYPNRGSLPGSGCIPVFPEISALQRRLTIAGSNRDYCKNVVEDYARSLPPAPVCRPPLAIVYFNFIRTVFGEQQANLLQI